MLSFNIAGILDGEHECEKNYSHVSGMNNWVSGEMELPFTDLGKMRGTLPAEEVCERVLEVL